MLSRRLPAVASALTHLPQGAVFRQSSNTPQPTERSIDEAPNEICRSPFPHDKYPHPPFLKPDVAPNPSRAETAAPGPAAQFTLNNGTRVAVRRIEGRDSEPLAEFLCSLSSQSYMARFPSSGVNTEFGLLPPPSATHIASALATGQQSEHKCFVALDSNDAIIGLVDYSASVTLLSMVGVPSSQCEVSVVIADHMQQTGLGPKLLQEAMTAAKREGYETMCGHRHVAGTLKKYKLDLNKPLRRQHEPCPRQSETASEMPSLDPYWSAAISGV